MPFTGAPVQGVIKKNHDGTLNLIMTLRRRYADVFWFTFFHEIGHILNGDIGDRLIDYADVISEMEDQADEFAANMLIEPGQYELFAHSGDFSLQSIQHFCTELDVPAFILIGRLQRDKYLNYDQHVREKVKYDLRRIERTIV